MALAAAGAGHLLLVDDDRIELHNLHRQCLYREADCGRHKLDAPRRVVARGFPAEGFRAISRSARPRSASAGGRVT
jgi:molybdopterin/thiamine biosynthesis adenylyltransferase